MNRKRALISDTFMVKKRRDGTTKFGAVSDGDGRCDSYIANSSFVEISLKGVNISLPRRTD